MYAMERSIWACRVSVSMSLLGSSMSAPVSSRFWCCAEMCILEDLVWQGKWFVPESPPTRIPELSRRSHRPGTEC